MTALQIYIGWYNMSYYFLCQDTSVLSLSCSSFPELPTLIKVSPSDILLDELAKETTWRPYGVAAVGLYYYKCLAVFKLPSSVPAGSSPLLSLLNIHPPTHPPGESIKTAFYSKTSLVKLVLLVKLTQVGRQTQFFSVGRRPHFFFNWKTTSKKI